MDLRGKRIEEGYTNLVTVEGDSVASSGKLQNGQGTDLGNIAVGGLSFNSGDGELQLPAGTTAERPASPSAGYARFNTDKGKVEIYTGASWLSIALEGAVQLEAATATVTANDAVAELGGFIEQFGTPASAFSVRKLGSTDVCMRVRRSSDNAEQNIGFDGGDLDETALTTFVGANDGFVTTWYDQSVDNSTLPAEHGSGATASYSLRLVDSTYTGDAIRVRRSSDNAEQDIGFVDGELDTSSLETFCSGTNGFVTTWYDQSGSNDATQATAGSQPQIVSSGSTILENGKPALDFDGTNLLLTPAYAYTGTAWYASGVASFDLTSLARQILNQDSGGGGDRVAQYIRVVDGTSESIGFASGGSPYFETGVSVSTNTQSILTSVNDGSNLEIFVNGATDGSTSHSTQDSDTQPLEIGGANGNPNFNGQIQEVLLYTDDQSANRESIELNQASYYDIGVSIGATQATAGSQPKIVSSGSVIKENSQPIVTFDGSDDALTISGSSSSLKFIHDGGNASIFTSVRTASSSNPTTAEWIAGSAGGSGVNVGILMGYDDRSITSSNNKLQLQGYRGVGGTSPLSFGVDDVLTPNQINLVSAFIDLDNATAGDRGTFAINGGTLQTGNTETDAPSSANSTYDLQIGALGNDVAPSDIAVHEFVIYNADKSSDQSSIESNIATYYNITI